MKKIALTLIITGIGATAQAKDVDFADLFKNVTDGIIVAETAPGDTLVFKGGSFVLGASGLVIRAARVRVDANTLVVGFPWGPVPDPMLGTPDPPGVAPNGGAWGCETRIIKLGHFIELPVTQCRLEGQDGFTGTPGSNGRRGAAPGLIDAELGTVEGTALLALIANGQRGGKGQKGGPGGLGGIGVNGDNRGGNVYCGDQNSRLNGSSGGRGGRGGTGGQGGPGGPGGTARVEVSDPAVVAQLDDEMGGRFALASGPDQAWASLNVPLAVHVVVAAPGGFGGDGGERGGAGTSGAGGSGGKSSHCGGGGDPGPEVPSLGEGDLGPGGEKGPTGSVSIGQH